MSAEHGNLSRRGFLDRSLSALAAAGLPLWFAREVLADETAAATARRTIGPNDQIVMGAIGVGGMGTGDLKSAMGQPGVRFVAVCDVDAGHRDRAAKLVKEKQGGDCATYNDFRELLAKHELDAVTISTPDHWHALVAIAAMKAGCDVHCQKPLTLTIAEGQAMVKVARATGAVFQTGSQQRSNARYRLACELVRNGRVGKVHTVEARIGENPRGGPFRPVPVPDGLDWDLWQGQTPEAPYLKERCHGSFRWWYEYSGGKMTDWGAHHNDIAQWALGMDETGPVAATAVESNLKADPNGYNIPSHFAVTFTYADGTRLVTTSEGENGNRFVGDNGWIFVSRSRIAASDPKLLSEPLPADATRLDVSSNHMRNFIDGVRGRKRPICDVSVGHRSVSVCHIGNIALRLGVPVQWDPAAERFVGFGAEKANAMVSRPMRSPWKLEV